MNSCQVTLLLSDVTQSNWNPSEGSSHGAAGSPPLTGLNPLRGEERTREHGALIVRGVSLRKTSEDPYAALESAPSVIALAVTRRIAHSRLHSGGLFSLFWDGCECSPVVPRCRRRMKVWSWLIRRERDGEAKNEERQGKSHGKKCWKFWCVSWGRRKQRCRELDVCFPAPWEAKLVCAARFCLINVTFYRTSRPIRVSILQEIIYCDVTGRNSFLTSVPALAFLGAPK